MKSFFSILAWSLCYYAATLALMEKAGFSDIQVHNTSVVMCIIATK